MHFLLLVLLQRGSTGQRSYVTLQWRHNGAITSQITILMLVYSTVYSDPDQRKHQRSASLAFARGIHRSPVNSPHKWPVTWIMFSFDDVIMMGIHWSPIDSFHRGSATSENAMFSLLLTWTSCWRNNGVAVALRHHDEHMTSLWYDVRWLQEANNAIRYRYPIWVIDFQVIFVPELTIHFLKDDRGAALLITIFGNRKWALLLFCLVWSR